MSNIFLEKIAREEGFVDKVKNSTFVQALGMEGSAIGAGLAMKAVGARFGGGALGHKMSNSKLGRAAAKYLWNSKDKLGKAIPVPGGVLTGEIGEYAGSLGAVYGALKYKEHLDKNKHFQKAASLLMQQH